MPQGDIRIVDHPAMRIAGLQIITSSSFNKADNSAKTDIPELFGRFWSRYEELKHDSAGAVYGVSFPADDNEPPLKISYLAGIVVDNSTPLPVGFSEIRIPAGRYAHFTHAGLFETLDESTSVAYLNWLPSSGFQFRNAPHFELYDSRFDTTSPDCEMDICIPIAT